MRIKHGIVLSIILIIAAAALYLLGTSGSEPDYSSFSTETDGAGLLYDTLHRMGYPVSRTYQPIDTHASVNDVYLVIMPDDPTPDETALDAMLAWVRRGGRMIFLDAYFPSPMDEQLADSEVYDYENLSHYYYGLGEVITGVANDFANENLMHNSFYGSMITYSLELWNADHIYFAEYYHGYRAVDNLFARLPQAAKLCAYQLLLAAAALIVAKGKRWGKPIPLYEETERTGDEYARALARLYYKTKAEE